MEKILIIDDDEDIAELESYILKEDGLETVIKNSGEEALEVLDKEKFDLILMDIMMPGISGIELCAQIRSKVTCSIIFVTAKANIVDKIIGFEIGGDDYVTKPFDNQELLLKVKSHLRKDKRNLNDSNNNINKNENIEINKESFEDKKDGKIIDLSTREFELLKYLMENKGIVLSKSQIFDAVWGSNYGEISTVAVHMKKLRDKLDKEEKYIITVWGYGYKFVRSLDE